MLIRRVMQAHATAVKLRALDASVGAREAQTQKIRGRLVAQGKLISSLRAQKGMIVLQAFDPVDNVISDLPATAAAPEQLDARPNEHALRGTKLSARGLGLEVLPARFRQKELIDFCVQADALAVRDT